jgi:hypothetical protein
MKSVIEYLNSENGNNLIRSKLFPKEHKNRSMRFDLSNKYLWGHSGFNSHFNYLYETIRSDSLWNNRLKDSLSYGIKPSKINSLDFKAQNKNMLEHFFSKRYVLFLPAVVFDKYIVFRVLYSRKSIRRIKSYWRISSLYLNEHLIVLLYFSENEIKKGWVARSGIRWY